MAIKLGLALRLLGEWVTEIKQILKSEQENGEKCIWWTFIICILHKI
jgi:hypothetical protein